MLKNEVISSLKTELKKKGVIVTQAEATVFHDTVFENVANILASGEEISVVNFGTFYSSYTTANDINNHIKGTVMNRIQVFVLKFRVSDSLKAKLNGKKTK